MRTDEERKKLILDMNFIDKQIEGMLESYVGEEMKKEIRAALTRIRSDITRKES